MISSVIISNRFSQNEFSHQKPQKGKNFHILISTLISAIFIFFAFATSMLLAQKAPMKWGKIDKAMLEMKTFPQDTNAAAVILCEYGQSYITAQIALDYKVHRRIKILKEAGYDWGTVSIQYYAKDRLQVVKGIKGQTYTLSSDGKIVKNKLDKKSIFEEDVDGKRKRIKFTLPKLQPGAIIEFQYTIQSTNPVHLRGWAFQNSEPTLISEYRIWIPEFLRYVSVFQGPNNFDVQEANSQNRFQIKGEWQRWVMRDIAALRREPYMTTLEDFRAKVRLQLADINIPGEVYEKYLTSWEDLAKRLIEDRDFGKQCNKKGLLPKETLADIYKLDTPHKRIEAVFNYVRNTVMWDRSYGIYAEENLKDALKKRSASSAEMSFMLISILRELGLDANPVILSTRDHGKIIALYPLAKQFNYVLTYVIADNETYILDPTDPLRPFNLLPDRALNGIGWLVRKKNAQWLRINATGKHKKRITISAQLAASGALTGQINAVDYDYAALKKRNYIHNNDQEKYVDEYFMSDIFGAAADSFKIKYSDNTNKPLKTTIDFKTDEAVQASGNFIYLNPILLGKYDENPFKLAVRTFPVDYAYGRDVVYMMNLSLPPNYTIDEQPKNITIRLPENSGFFQRVIQVNGNRLSVLCKIKIVKTMFEPGEYAGLREFYDRIVSAQAEQVVLKLASN